MCPVRYEFFNSRTILPQVYIVTRKVFVYSGHHCQSSWNIVTCRVVRVTKWRVLVPMIGFIGTLVTTVLSHIQIQTIQSYRWFTHPSYFTVTRTQGFPVFTSLLATDLNTETIAASLDHTLPVWHINTDFKSQFRLHRSSTNLPWLSHIDNSLTVT
jgi:hypothetical protein